MGPSLVSVVIGKDYLVVTQKDEKESIHYICKVLEEIIVEEEDHK